MTHSLISSCIQRAVCSVGPFFKPTLLCRTSQFFGRQISYPSVGVPQRNCSSNIKDISSPIFLHGKGIEFSRPEIFLQNFSRFSLLSPSDKKFLVQQAARRSIGEAPLQDLKPLSGKYQDFMEACLKKDMEEVADLLEKYSFSFSMFYWLELLEQITEYDSLKGIKVLEAFEFNMSQKGFPDLDENLNYFSKVFQKVTVALVESNPTSDTIKPFFRMYNSLHMKTSGRGADFAETMQRFLSESLESALSKVKDKNAFLEPFLTTASDVLSASSDLSKGTYVEVLALLAEFSPELVKERADWKRLSKEEGHSLLLTCHQQGQLTFWKKHD